MGVQGIITAQQRMAKHGKAAVSNPFLKKDNAMLTTADDVFYSWREVASLLGISRRTLERRIETFGTGPDAIHSRLLRGEWHLPVKDIKRLKL